MKIFRWLSDNLLFVLTLFLLAFIPLYPKLPLIDIKNTWVYIRVDDFAVVIGLLVWLIQLIRGKITLKSPLTLPILIFWILGAVATIHAVLIIFPTIPNVFSNVAFLSFLRRVEYISLFFIAFSSMIGRKRIPIVVGVLVVTLLLVVAYGFGQRYLGFPAFLTMNEEYAKGVAIILSPQSRVPSTFAGHYDLAAYLVLLIPILASMIFGFRNWLVRIILAVSVGLGFVLLFMTVSRSSFFVLLISLIVLLFLQKKKIILFALPVVGIVLIFLSLNFSSNLLQRFGSTVKEVDVLVDARTGEPIGHVKVIQTASFADKLVLRREFGEKNDLNIDDKDPFLASSSAIVPFIKLPHEAITIVPLETSTGENLPQGTGYVNLTLSPVNKRLPVFFYEKLHTSSDASQGYVTMFEGNFLVKRALAYDRSFTTRFQGEWPNAIQAFKRNILFGSGYSSISLAVDNNFLRILGETGLLGFVSFFGIFIMAGVYIKRILPNVESPVVRSFVLGFVAGVIGILLNAVLIDVFEASKVAYLLWLLMGITLGALHLYQTDHISLLNEFKKVITSQYAIFVYICLLAFIIFWQATGNYFIGDDFTWLRWAADCSNMSSTGVCPSWIQRVSYYFTHADGFFYRPGTKVYFSAMYSLFWLNEQVYHMVPIILHITVSMLLFLLIRKVTKNNTFATFSIFLFLVLSGYTEEVFWIAATGHLFNAMFILLSVLLFLKWDEKKQTTYLILSLASFTLSLLFHELGVVVPFLILLIKFTTERKFRIQSIFQKIEYMLFGIPILGYLIVRFIAGSHWFSGDYNYNLMKLPFNLIGNAIGYFILSIFGPVSLSIYQVIRTFFKEQVFLLGGLLIIALFIAVYFGLKRNMFKYVVHYLSKREDQARILIFGILFFLITLLPFLGLGNITSRYSYLASGGTAIILTFLFLKLYRYLLRSGKDVAFTSLTAVVLVFCLFHIIQTLDIYGDWREAGVRTKNFITSVDASFQDQWSREKMEFYFVNVPIRVGNAWMFPVGLDDALWFVFRNPHITVHQEQSVDDALRKVERVYTQKVFEFQGDGSVVEKRRKDLLLYGQ